MSQTESPTEVAAPVCRGCGTLLAPALLACPGCATLVHRDALMQLSAAAETATHNGDFPAALSQWRQALELLPAHSKQHAAITTRIQELRAVQDSSSLESGEPRPPSTDAATSAPPQRRKGVWAGISSTLVLVFLKLKPLLFGLTKLGTLASMAASLGVYWVAFGWQFAVGLVGCIYVHEIGHVVALQRLGIAASSPMFIPGLGALVRLKQYPVDVNEDAQVGLAGPRWGLGISVVVFLTGHALHAPALLAIARVSAWLNLFNLIPLGPLDGGRGFRALSNQQRVICTACLGALYLATHQTFVAILAGAALLRSFERRPSPSPQNVRILIEYLGLALMLAVLSRP